MRLTLENEAVLEDLKNSFCLGIRLNPDAFIKVKGTYVYVFRGYETEDRTYKPLFGKKRTDTFITKFIFSFDDNVGTKYVSTTKATENTLSFIEQDRKNFIQMRKSLEKFNWFINHKEKDSAS